MDKQYHFTYWDYTAFGAIFVLSSSIGFYHIWTARKSSNALEFLVHNRNLQLLPLMLSFVGTFVSAVGILGLPNEVYTNGVVFMATFIPFLLIIPFGVYLFVPMFFNLEIASIFQVRNYNRFWTFNINFSIASIILILASACNLHYDHMVHTILYFFICQIGDN